MCLTLLCGIAFSSVSGAEGLPPKSIYHFGQQTYLMQDAELDTIPEVVWNDVVMGAGGRYTLLPR